MTIPFRVKLLTETAKAPERANEGDLWDLFADDFCFQNLEDRNATMYKSIDSGYVDLSPMGRVLVKTGIAIELPKAKICRSSKKESVSGKVYYLFEGQEGDCLKSYNEFYGGYRKGMFLDTEHYAVADIRPRSGLAIKHGITVLNTPGTIDNSYRKEIGVILYNAGHESYTIEKGDKIAQMLIRPLYPSSFAVVKDFEDSGRGGFNSTGY